MRIFIEYDLKNESGKGRFIQRLTKQWDEMGVKYSDNPKGCDARLAITRYRTKSNLPTAIRIDGAHNEIHAIKGKDRKKLEKSMLWKNKHTADCVKRSDAVIWQSDFCRRMGHVVFGKNPKREYVIFNGDDPANYLPRKPEKIVVLSAHWKARPHKRLKEMLEVADSYTKIHPDVMFHVLGDIHEEIGHGKNVVMHGMVGLDEMKEMFSRSACMLNICYADWCPNAVVEALVAGVPVICTANHGVSEIVRECGIIVDIDEPIPRKHFKRAMNMPIRDIQPVYTALDRMLIMGEAFPPAEHLYIEKIAKQYAGVFNAIVR